MNKSSKNSNLTLVAVLATLLRIWGSGVRISSGAPFLNRLTARYFALRLVLQNVVQSLPCCLEHDASRSPLSLRPPPPSGQRHHPARALAPLPGLDAGQRDFGVAG